MNDERFTVRSLTLHEDGGCAIEYLEPRKDIRQNGLVINKVIYIPAGSDYDDELEDLRHAVQALLTDAEQDLRLVEPINFDEEST